MGWKLAIFLASLVILILIIVFGSHYSSLPQGDFVFAIAIVMRAVGGLVAAACLFVMLLSVMAGKSLDQNLLPVLVFLGGVLLFEINWATALAVGMVAGAAIAVKGFGGSKPPPSP